jgi:hypothetical protein
MAVILLNPQAMDKTAFQEYVTSSAFRLDLSPNMVQWLLYEYKYGGKKGKNDLFSFDHPHFCHAFSALQRRGLMLKVWDIPENGFRPKRLTEEGILVAKLCIKAGFELELRENNSKKAKA